MKTKAGLKILILNGPNLNLLGRREPDIYGKETLSDIEALIRSRARELGASMKARISLDFRQSNSEADLIGWIGGAMGEFDGVIINPAALTHTSIGVLDAIKASGLPCVEVHLSNVHAREDFRTKSVTAAGCIGQIMGFRSTGYVLALEGLVEYIQRPRQTRSSGGRARRAGKKRA